MQSIKTTLTGALGQSLSAKIDLPAYGQPRSFALFAHCFTCGKDLAAIKNISRALTKEGIAVLRFDFTGLGQSEGEFENSTFSNDVADLIHLAQELEKQGQVIEMLIGHSLGGAAVIAAADQLPQVKAVVSIGAPAAPEHVTHLFEEALDTIQKEGKARVKLAGRPFTIGKSFVEDIEERKLKACLKNFKGAYLNLHAPEDEYVGIDNASALFKMAHHPKSYISLDGMDHLLSQATDSLRVGKLIAAWVDSYISAPADWEKDFEGKEEIGALSTAEDGYTTLLKLGHHNLLSDEPRSLGGKDLGPSPYELLSGALASCTAITMRMYAERKGWPVDDIHVYIEHQKIEAPDHLKDAAKKRKIDHFTRRIRIEGDLSEDQRSRMMEIANKCPVHRSLHMPVVVESEAI